MDGWAGVYELRERTVQLLERIAADHADNLGSSATAAMAAGLLVDLRATWVREKRWRNSNLPVAVLHIAGPVIDCRQPRPSCPRYIVDRRQACARCGAELIHGRWAVFFDVGAPVGVLGSIAYLSTGHHQEVPCT